MNAALLLSLLRFYDEWGWPRLGEVHARMMDREHVWHSHVRSALRGLPEEIRKSADCNKNTAFVYIDCISDTCCREEKLDAISQLLPPSYVYDPGVDLSSKVQGKAFHWNVKTWHTDGKLCGRQTPFDVVVVCWPYPQRGSNSQPQD